MVKTQLSLPVAIYLRVSKDSQTTDNQRIALEAAAAARGWTVIRIYQDQGISGGKGRDQRPGLDALLKDAAKGHFSLVAAWAKRTTQPPTMNGWAGVDETRPNALLGHTSSSWTTTRASTSPALVGARECCGFRVAKQKADMLQVKIGFR